MRTVGFSVTVQRGSCSGPGAFRTQRVPLPVPLARPLTAASIGLSSSVLASFDVDFEGLAATKNTPRAADHVELFAVIFGDPNSDSS